MHCATTPPAIWRAPAWCGSNFRSDQRYHRRHVQYPDGRRKALNLAYLGQAEPDDNEGYTVGFDEDTVRSTNQPPGRDFNLDNGANGGQAFGSSHLDRFNAVFADGSVRTIGYSITQPLFSYLGNKSDGQVIGSFD